MLDSIKDKENVSEILTILFSNILEYFQDFNNNDNYNMTFPLNGALFKYISDTPLVKFSNYMIIKLCSLKKDGDYAKLRSNITSFISNELSLTEIQNLTHIAQDLIDQNKITKNQWKGVLEDIIQQIIENDKTSIIESF